MDDGPQHIEIELTEHAGTRSRGWRRRSGPAADPPAGAPATDHTDARGRPSTSPSAETADAAPDVAVTHGPEPVPSHGSDRGRLVATGLVAGVVALVIGWTLGRAGGDGSAQTVDATSTTDRTATTVGDTVLPGEVPPAASLPTTTRPPRTTTTTLPPVWVETTITVDPRLTGATDRIVAISADRELIELDLATGALRAIQVDSWPRAQTPLPPVAGDDWVAVQFDDGRNPFLYRGDDTEPSELSLRDPGWLFWDLTNQSVWSLNYDNAQGRPVEMIEVSLDGTPTGRAMPFHGFWPLLPDPTGGVVVSDGSAVFSVRVDGSARIAEGRVVAMGTRHVLSFACGDTIDDCGLRVTDRETGESRAVPTEVDDPYAFEGWWGGPPPTAMVSADGEAALLTAANDTGPSRPIVLDTVTGQIHELGSGGRGPYPSAVWSHDGRWAFTVDGTVVAYDRTTGETFPVSEDLPAISTVTVRPAG